MTVQYKSVHVLATDGVWVDSKTPSRRALLTWKPTIRKGNRTTADWVAKAHLTKRPSGF